MSEIIQLYKDKEKTIKVYAKTLASEVYLDDGTTKIGNKFDKINLQLEQIAQQATKFSNPTRAWNKSKKNNVYESWAFTCSFYDDITDDICLVYTSKDYHTSLSSKIYFRKKKDIGNFSDSILIADGYKVHCANKLNDGSYICIGIKTNNSFERGEAVIFKSTNKGESWQEIGNINSSPFSCSTWGEISGLFVAKNNSIFAYGRDGATNKNYILKSVDNCSSWQTIEVVNANSLSLLEGNFVELSDNTLCCVIRGGLLNPDFTKHISSYLITSTDNGNTWSNKIELDIEASYNPIALLYHEDIKAVEVLYGSRLKENGNDNGSLYQAIAKEEEFKKGIIPYKTKIAIGGIEGDFGYCELVKSKNNVINAFFYIDEYDSSGACIMQMIGTRNNSFKNVQYDNPVIILPTNTVNGNTPPSYYKNLVMGESATIKCRVFANTEGLPSTKKGEIVVECYSYNNGYNRCYFIEALSLNKWERRDYEGSDNWLEWVNITPSNEKIEMTTSLMITTPFTRYSFIKSPITLFDNSTDNLTNNVEIDVLSKVSEQYKDWFNTNVDGIKLEIVASQKSGLTSDQQISFDSDSFKQVQGRRLLFNDDRKHCSIIDCFLSSNKTVKMTTEVSANIDTLLVRLVGVLFKQK